MQDDPPDYRARVARQPESGLAAGATGPVRAQLRHATADIHESLHRHPGFARLMAGVLDMPEYSTLLGRLYGFHWPVEIGLRASSDGLLGEPVGPIDPTKRETALLLHADLLHLGVSQREIHAIPCAMRCRPSHRRKKSWVCLYVIDGSVLGGKVLARKLDRLLGDQGRAGRQFLMGQPEPDPMHWPKFCRSLEAWAAGRDLVAITGGARRTFECTDIWLRSGDGDA